MAYRTVEFTLISAKDLKDVNLLHKMEVYAEVVLSTDPRSKQRTLTDCEGLKNPTWNSTLKFTVPSDPGATGTFHVMLRAERSLGDRDVGEVHIALKEILEAATGDGPTQPKFVSYQVWKPSGKPKGVLNISYKLSACITAPSCTASANTSCSSKPAKTGCSSTASYQPPPPATAPATRALYQPPPATTSPYPPPPPGYPTPGLGPTKPVIAYPAASSAPPTAYPAPPPQYGTPPPYTYAPPPQYGYGPPPPQPGYSYPPYGYQPAAQAQPVKPKKNKKNNNGFGAGLIGGALGGLILGDIVADAGYDDGFDDAGGFDF